jgi:hypothetical protein
MSGEEARARLRSGRPFSALLVDAGLAALDRDLVELTHSTSPFPSIPATAPGALDLYGRVAHHSHHCRCGQEAGR